MKSQKEHEIIENKKIEEKERLKRRKNRKNVKKVDIKVLLKGKTIRKTKTEKYTALLDASFPEFEKEVVKYYQGKSKIIDDKQTLVELLTEKRFAKPLINVLMERETLSQPVYFAISELYVNDTKAFINEVKLVKNYLKVFTHFHKKKIKKLKNKLGISKMEALHLLLCSYSYKGVKLKAMRKRYMNFCKTIYELDELSVAKVIDAIKMCFPKNTYQFIAYALGERNRNENGNGNPNFSIMTEAILKLLEKMDNSDRKDILKSFAKNRQKNPNYKIRVNLYTIDESKYKKVIKTVDKLVYTGLDKELFM